MKALSTRIIRWVIAGVSAICISAAALAEDSIVVDPNTGDYIITYGSARVKWIPATKIDPSIRWDIKSRENGPDVLVYRYKFENGRQSRQYLEGGRLVASNAIPDSATSPAGWRGNVSKDPNSSSYFVSWFFDTNDIGGLKIGSSLGGFAFTSTALPGVGQVDFFGSAPAGQAFPLEGPDELSPIRAQFDDITSHDFVPRNAAIPRITVPTPFDASVVIDGIKTHIDTDLVNLKLVDPILVSQLDRSLQAAIDAAKINNITAVKSNLRDARRLLKEQVPDVDATYNFNTNPNKPKTRLIDPQAAWVLNFDIQYVERRL